jgi:hypothetical protein
MRPPMIDQGMYLSPNSVSLLVGGGVAGPGLAAGIAARGRVQLRSLAPADRTRDAGATGARTDRAERAPALAPTEPDPGNAGGGNGP